MTYLLPACLLIAAAALGFSARTRFGMPAGSRLFVLVFALLIGIATAVAQHYGLALLMVASGAAFSLGSLVKTKFALGQPQHRFCPNCATELEHRDFEGHLKLACPSCSYVFWNNPIVVGVALIPSEDGNSIVLVKRGVEPKMDMYCLPGGFGEPNEHPAQTAARESAEESNLDVEIDRLLAVHAAPGGNQVLVFYLAKPSPKQPSPGSDAREAKFFRLDELPDNIAFSTHAAVIKAWRETWLAGKSA